MRFLFYSHDAVGLGHVRRHLAIAAALADQAPGTKVLLATSVDEVASLGLPPNVDTLKLPGLRKVASNHYASRRLDIPASEIRQLRAHLLQAAVRAFRPAVLLVDKHPLGAAGELQLALESSQAMGAKAVLGLRDILDQPEAVLQEWAAEGLHMRIADYHELVLVYGNEAVFDPIAEYVFPEAVAQRTRYCGYVVNHSPCPWHSAQCPYLPVPSSEQRPVVLGTAGGGEDGFAMLQAFIGAAVGAPWKAVAVAGPMSDEADFQILQQMAAANGVALHNFIPCLPSLFGQVDGLVCMGGYNTLVEAISNGVPVVCVPRTSPRTEQLLRARLFERRGLLRMVHPRDLTADKLRQELSGSLALSRQERIARAHQTLDFDGAQRAAEHLLRVFEKGRRGRVARQVRVVEAAA